MIEWFSQQLSRNGKIVLAIWLAAVLMLVPAAAGAFGEMNYHVSDMADRDSESAKADLLISAYFDGPSIDVTSMPVLVIGYNSQDAYDQLKGSVETGTFEEFLAKHISLDAVWSVKLDSQHPVLKISSSGDSSSGMMAFVLTYNDTYSTSSIEKDTPNLRAMVKKTVDDFIFESFSDSPQFSYYVTGSPALAYDSTGDATNVTVTTLVVLLVISLILAGLFFGSAMSSVVVASAAVFTAIPTMAVCFGLSRIFGLFYLVVAVVLIMVVLMAIAHSILVVSAFRKHTQAGIGRDEAVMASVEDSIRPILVSGAVMAAIAVVLMFAPFELISHTGVFMFFAVMIEILCAVTVPASVIDLTRNEMFWEGSVEGKIKWSSVTDMIRKASSVVKNGVGAIYGFVSRSAPAVIAVSVVVTVCAASYVVLCDPYDNLDYNAADSLYVGESKEGMNVLTANREGGLFAPYSAVIEYNSPIAKIVNDSSLTSFEMRAMVWIDDAAYGKNQSLANSVRGCDNNVIGALSLFSWSYEVSAAEAQGLSDSEEIVNSIIAKAAAKDPVQGRLLKEKIEELTNLGITYLAIRTAGAPVLDYTVNNGSGLIGHEMVSDGSVVVNRIMMKITVADNPSSMRSIKTTDAIENTISGFVKNNSLKGYSITGEGKVFQEITSSLDGDKYVRIVLVVAVVFVILALLAKALMMPIRVILTVSMTSLVSMALLTLTTGLFSTVSFVLLLLIPYAAIFLGQWFDGVQHVSFGTHMDSGAEREDAIRNMVSETAPVILSTGALLVFSLASLTLSHIGLLLQFGLAVVILVLVDALVVRMLVTPAILSLEERFMKKGGSETAEESSE